MTAVNATKMRHRISSIFASLDMNPKDQKIFLDHMGHDMNINKDNYQCPPGVQAVCVMGKMLSNADKGVHSAGDAGDIGPMHGNSKGQSPHDEHRLGVHGAGDVGPMHGNSKGQSPHDEHRLDVSSSKPSGYVSSNDNSWDDDDGETAERPVHTLRANTTKLNKSVKWSETDTRILRETFKDSVYSGNDQRNCRGSLPSKERIVHFLEENKLDSLSKLSLHDQYLKTRAKIFNERKTVRENTCVALEKMAIKKT